MYMFISSHLFCLVFVNWCSILDFLSINYFELWTLYTEDTVFINYWKRSIHSIINFTVVKILYITGWYADIRSKLFFPQTIELTDMTAQQAQQRWINVENWLLRWTTKIQRCFNVTISTLNLQRWIYVRDMVGGVSSQNMKWRVLYLKRA
jgi:hypothetical protein